MTATGLEVAQIVLLIPHSNTAIERLFSLVNKNKNELSNRNRLDQDKTLSSILAVSLIVLTQVQLCVISFSLIKNYWVWQKRQLLLIKNPTDTDVFKTSSGRLKKVTTSYDQIRRLIYDVLKTSYLRRLEDVKFTTS